MTHRQRPDIEKIEDTLDQTAEWLIACYGQRIVGISLTLEGFFCPDEVYWGVVPSMIRAVGESRETLSSLDARALAEGAFLSVFPAAVFEKGGNRDIRDVARSRTVKSSDLSAHRRLEVLDLFSRPGCQGPGRRPRDRRS